VGLTGKTGCGKSTLVQLLQGSASPDKGGIYVGGIPLPQIKMEWWQERLSIVTQEPFLFSESIRNNLLFGCKNPVSDEQLIEITKHCCIHEEILSFKDGYDTLVGERGVNLSGGQKQRICLARALLRNPEILVLDDCLSALDAITSLKILSYLMSLKGTHTILLISSRPNDLVGCDIIYFMKNGKISSGGKHEELLEKEPDYHKLWDLYKKKSLGFSEI
jgi:ABC-type multidrug transport system fused ATPase/permease subunit